MLPTPSVISALRKNAAGYSSDGSPEWLPKDAEFEVRVDFPGEDECWRTIFLDLASGPAYLYDYFPFTSFVYIDDRLDSIAEFTCAAEKVSVPIRLPTGKSVKITIATELGRVPATLSDGLDVRELSVELHGMRLGDIVPAPPTPMHGLEARADHYSRRLSPLVRTVVRPVFVIGPYRSGTSILTWALGQHPNIWPMEETGWLHFVGAGAMAGYRSASAAHRNFFDVYSVGLREYMAQFGESIHNLMRTASLRHADAVNLGRLARTPSAQGFDPRFQYFRSLFNPKERWVDGTPENAHHVSLLRALFPGARFICMVRNPVDVVTSMMHFNRAGGQSQQVSDAAAMWRRLSNASLKAARAYGPKVVKVMVYEKMIEDPATAMSEIFDFLGEPQFVSAAETFEKRINSSKLTGKLRARVLRHMIPQGIKDELATEHEELVEAFGLIDAPDPQVALGLGDLENDVVTRVQGILS